MTDQIPIEHAPGEHNRDYLRAKKDRLGHMLHHQGLALDEEMIHEERVQDRERALAETTDPYGEGPRRAARARAERVADVFAACVGRFYEELADRLVEGATRVFEEAGASVDVHDVPGAFELPLAARYCARLGPLRRRGVPRRRDPRRDGPLRLRLRRGRERHRARGARHRACRARSGC